MIQSLKGVIPNDLMWIIAACLDVDSILNDYELLASVDTAYGLKRMVVYQKLKHNGLDLSHIPGPFNKLIRVQAYNDIVSNVSHSNSIQKYWVSRGIHEYLVLPKGSSDNIRFYNNLFSVVNHCTKHIIDDHIILLGKRKYIRYMFLANDDDASKKLNLGIMSGSTDVIKKILVKAQKRKLQAVADKTVIEKYGKLSTNRLLKECGVPINDMVMDQGFVLECLPHNPTIFKATNKLVRLPLTLEELKETRHKISALSKSSGDYYGAEELKYLCGRFRLSMTGSKKILVTKLLDKLDNPIEEEFSFRNSEMVFHKGSFKPRSIFVSLE